MLLEVGQLLRGLQLFVALGLAGCAAAGGSAYPTAQEVEALRCRGKIRVIGEGMGQGPYPDKVGEQWRFRCAMTRKDCLGYEVSSDHKSFRVFCKGDNHVRAGLPLDYPCFTSGVGVESGPGLEMALPKGFPLKFSYKKLLKVEAMDQGGPIVVEAEVDPEVVARELTAKWGDPMQRKGERMWGNLVSPLADGLGAVLAGNVLRVGYQASHLAD